ncbi:hypothetical protein A3A49_00050 [Candidatus Curtissbacteria bacterium RIFCSPLOWO2_01_FULL_38_11b]|uniref:DUF192 domain-containing protein n=1 Tax=Candidatus Curtissbacteria bacterium RIFCSPLOWO2_01_FULL_38_11b TaxID=1797725 RepID=A0A1F5H2D8_9BACT|nr:MAG: hypothetical protein A3A49_00050 [Candidatus Curtissbacteria bacterium RIFCSPLOWO2_01_FULL_38_11b]
MNLKKDLAIVGGLFLLVVALLIFGRGFTTGTFVEQRQEATPSQQASSNLTQDNNNRSRVSIKTLSVFVEIARTSDSQKKGLSGRDQLAINEGLLFVFDTPAKYAFWMKDMKFPIDIIWIDGSPAGEKKIVDIAENATVEPGKNDEELKRYTPRADALYVLEINAGLVKHNNLQIGDVVNFELQ